MKNTIADLFKALRQEPFPYDNVNVDDLVGVQPMEAPTGEIFSVDFVTTNVLKILSWGSLNFTTKQIIVGSPIPMVKIYSDVADLMDDWELMSYEMPMVALTKNLFNLQHGWTFIDDNSRNKVREASWTEGDDMYMCIEAPEIQALKL